MLSGLDDWFDRWLLRNAWWKNSIRPWSSRDDRSPRGRANEIGTIFDFCFCWSPTDWSYGQVSDLTTLCAQNEIGHNGLSEIACRTPVKNSPFKDESIAAENSSWSDCVTFRRITYDTSDGVTDPIGSRPPEAMAIQAWLDLKSTA